jgi:hypothetical protein
MTQTATQGGSQQAADNNAIRPFQVDVVPEAELTELRRRIKATRWRERETVADASQGVQLATTQALAAIGSTTGASASRVFRGQSARIPN